MSKKYHKHEVYNLEEVRVAIEDNDMNLIFEELYEFFKTAKVTITEEEVKACLEKAKADYKKTRREESKAMSKADVSFDKLALTRYDFKPGKIEYFKEFINRLTNKTLIVCYVCDRIINDDLREEDKQLIPNFDEAINIIGDTIDGDTVTRLAKMIKTNYRLIKEHLDRANNPERYLNSTFLPAKEVQRYNAFGSADYTCLEPSTYQRAKAKDKDIQNFHRVLEITAFKY